MQAVTATDENINPYQPPTSPADGEGDRAPWWPGFANLLALLLTVGLLLGVSFTRRRFDQLFADFETELPVATTIALSPVSLVVAVGLLVTALATAFIPRAHRLRRYAGGLIVLATTVLGLLYALAICLPLMAIITELS